MPPQVAWLMVVVLLGGCTHERSPNATFPSVRQDLDRTSRRPAHALFVEYVPTPQDVVDEMLKMANVTKDDVVYDLGCGDGRILVTAAKRYGCRAYGCDIDRLRVQEARENAQEDGVAHLVTVERKDILEVDLQEATVVALYLSPDLIARLVPQLEGLRPGARIVSHDFPLPHIPPDRTAQVTSRADRREHTLYLWSAPLYTTK